MHTTHKDERFKQTLFIDISSSKCGNCNKGCDPHAKTHDFIYEYAKDSGTKPGCGIEWAYVSTNYADFNGHYDGVKKMRSDLEWWGFDWSPLDPIN